MHANRGKHCYNSLNLSKLISRNLPRTGLEMGLNGLNSVGQIDFHFQNVYEYPWMIPWQIPFFLVLVVNNVPSILSCKSPANQIYRCIIKLKIFSFPKTSLHYSSDWVFMILRPKTVKTPTHTNLWYAKFNLILWTLAKNSHTFFMCSVIDVFLE